MEGVTSFSSGGFASAGSGCLPLGSFEQPGRSSSGAFRTAGTGGVMSLECQQPKRLTSQEFFGNLSPAELMDDAKLAERHHRVQSMFGDLSNIDTYEAAVSMVQQAVTRAALAAN